MKDGSVKPEGVQLTFLPVMMPEPAFRMLHYREFDAAEMSLSWYTRTVLAQRAAVHRHPGLPVPHVPSLLRLRERRQRHPRARRPESGRRVGCPEYQMTAAVWLKGIMADRHGVPVDSVEYFTGGLEQPGRHEVPMNLPPSIQVTGSARTRRCRPCWRAGEIDALYTAHKPSSFRDATGTGKVRRLWPDPGAVERAVLRRHRHLPDHARDRDQVGHLPGQPLAGQIAAEGVRGSQATRLRGPLRDDRAEVHAPVPHRMGRVEPGSSWATTRSPTACRATSRTWPRSCRYSHEQGLSERLLEPRRPVRRRDPRGRPKYDARPVVVVTGAGQGLGRAFALDLAQPRLASGHRRPERRPREPSSERDRQLRRHGPRVHLRRQRPLPGRRTRPGHNRPARHRDRPGQQRRHLLHPADGPVRGHRPRHLGPRAPASTSPVRSSCARRSSRP